MLNLICISWKFGGAFLESDNTLVMSWLMQSVANMHMLQTLVAYGSNGFAIFYGGCAIGDGHVL